MEKGFNVGLISTEQFNHFLNKKSAVEEELKKIKKTRVKPETVNPLLQELGVSVIKEAASLYQLLKRPEISYDALNRISFYNNGLSQDVKNQVEIQVKYEGYIQRQGELAEKYKKIEEKQIPENFIYSGIAGFSKEIIEKLDEVRPLNIGQAGRIPGVTPAAVFLLMVAVERHKRQKNQNVNTEKIPNLKHQ
jgi:tRNA uridine 5-carboxymethylaminomethyl modification enzyme